MSDATEDWKPAHPLDESADRCLAVVLLWSVAEPHRVGQSAFLPKGDSRVLGRHGTLAWQAQRPEHSRPADAMQDPKLSRRQLELTSTGDAVKFENLGKIPVSVNGLPMHKGVVGPGDVLQLADRVLLGIVERPLTLPGEAGRRHRFGTACEDGLVGESEAAWTLRERVAFIGRRTQHALILGESGTGKELVARALHRHSSRARKHWVARNAATIPESLADAELFGNAAGYPNPGMPARPGLVGEADGSTLFLDEFGELPLEQQARLLRVMDDGEYTRLGEARPRNADLRVVGATNRDPDHLKHDVLARFPLRLQVPSLAERREDIPLLVRHLLSHIAQQDPELARRYFEEGEPRVHIDFVRDLVTRTYHTHIRELSSLLWRSLAESPGEVLVRPQDDLASTTPTPAPQVDGAVDPATLDPETIQEALDRHDGQQEPVWRELGLSSRHVLARLIKKHGLSKRR